MREHELELLNDKDMGQLYIVCVVNGMMFRLEVVQDDERKMVLADVDEEHRTGLVVVH